MLNNFLKPIPHIVHDDFLDERTLNEIIEYWPDDKYFYDEIKGIRLFDLVNGTTGLPEDQKKFWNYFKEKQYPLINSKIYECFREQIKKKFSTEDYPNPAQFNLMQSTSGFKTHAPHAHHYHNPNWAYTMLLYIQSDNQNTDGTDIYFPSESLNLQTVEDYTNFALKYIYGGSKSFFEIEKFREYKIDIVKKIEYKKNRLFAFFESPLSYHGVSDSTNEDKNYLTSERKIIRLHTCYPENFIKKFYNLEKEEYEKLRRSYGEFTDQKKENLKKIDPFIYQGIKKEIKTIL